MSATEIAPAPSTTPVLSPSQVRCFMDCHARWWFQYTLKHPDPPNGNLALGRAVHWALTQNFAQKIETYEDLPLAGVVALFREAWAFEREHAEFRDDEDPSQLALAGEALAGKYLDEVAPNVEPAAVELHVEGQIGGVRVQGFIDVLDVEGRIIDIKTAKASPSSIEPMNRFQIATYSQLAPAASGKGRVDTLAKTKTPKIVLQSFEVTQEDLRATQTIYARARLAMQSDIYMPNRSFAPAGIALTGATAKANGAGKFPSHETSTKPSLPGLDTHAPVRRLRSDGMDRSFPYRPARAGPEVLGLLGDSALFKASPEWQRQLPQARSEKVLGSPQPGPPCPRVPVEPEASGAPGVRVLHSAPGGRAIRFG